MGACLEPYHWECYLLMSYFKIFSHKSDNTNIELKNRLEEFKNHINYLNEEVCFDTN
jgi:hypothetical protein